jgi:hypothetical protein
VTLEKCGIDGATVHTALDSDGPVGGDHAVTVDGDGYRVVRWFYFDEVADTYVRNFAREVVREEPYPVQTVSWVNDVARRPGGQPERASGQASGRDRSNGRDALTASSTRTDISSAGV